MSVTQRAGKGSWRWRGETRQTIKKNWSIAWNQGAFPKPTSWQQIIDPQMSRAGCHLNDEYIPTPPRDVLRVGELMQFRSKEKLFLVRFFDSKRNWQWLPKSKMVPFGIDKTLDRSKMLEGRTSGIRKAVQSAFNRAMNHLSLVQDLGAGD